MRIRESTTIHATAAEVWPYIADPEWMAQWNPKIIEIEREWTGPVVLGEHYRITYRLKNRTETPDAEVIVCNSPHELTIRMQLDDRGIRREATETYVLEENEGQTKVVQTIDLSRTRIPFIFRMLIKLIYTFGKPQGKPYLQALKELVEDGLMATDATPAEHDETDAEAAVPVLEAGDSRATCTR